MSRSDVRNIKRLAERLGARDSDVIRFAIKLMLAKLSPLQDPTVGGRSLVPVFVEWGSELMRHFDLDAGTLAAIINEGVAEDRRVDSADIQLIAMNGIQRSFANARTATAPRLAVAQPARVPGRRADTGEQDSQGEEGSADSPEAELRTYLLQKYLGLRASAHGGASGEDL